MDANTTKYYNDLPSLYYPLVERLARLWLKAHGYTYNKSFEDLLRSPSPRANSALAFACASLIELDIWTQESFEYDLDDLAEFLVTAAS